MPCRLNAEQLATLFTKLQTLESAGLPAFQSVGILKGAQTGLDQSLALMARQLKSGSSIAEAGFRAGIFDDTQKTLIHAAETCGKLGEVYGRLASHYSSLSVRIKTAKSRMYLPALMLAVALFATPLPALIGGKMSGPEYLQLSLGRLLGIACGVYLLVRLPALLRSLGAQAIWHRLQLSIPLLARWTIRREINAFLFILALMLDAGVAFSAALPKAVASIENSALRQEFTPALVMAGTGASVAETLEKVPVIQSGILQILDSGETSGTLVESMMRHAALESDAIAIQDAAVAQWLPRIAYALVAIWMAHSLLGSHVATVIPENLQ